MFFGLVGFLCRVWFFGVVRYFTEVGGLWYYGGMKGEEIIGSIVSDAVFNMTGVAPLVKSKKMRQLQIYILEDNRVTIDLNLNARYGVSVPDIAYDIQTKVKKEVENKTHFKVDKVNINIISVVMPI